MILARSLVNDTFPGATATPGEGQILTNSSSISPFTIPFINSAIRRLYRKLGNSGVCTVIQDNVLLIGLTPVNGSQGVGIPDPAVQVSVTFGGYFDGTNLNASLQLPANTLSVLKLWERTSGTSNPFTEMTQSQFGLPSRNQVTYFGDWEYRSDGIYMVGSVNTEDIRMRLNVALGAVAGDGTDFANIFVPVQDSTDALAYNIAAVYTSARGGDEYASLMAECADITNDLANRQIRQRQAVPYQRESYGDSGWGGAGWY